MYKSTYRWQVAFAVLVVAVLALAAIQPAATTAQAASRSATKANQYTVTKTMAIAHGSLPALRNVPVVAFPADKALAGTNLPYKVYNPGKDSEYRVYKTDRTLPKAKNSVTGGLGPQKDTDTQAPSADLPAPDKRVYDDPMPGLYNYFDGANQGGNRTIYHYGVYPPDTNGAASPDYYVQVVNNLIIMLDRNQYDYYGDPKLVYGPAPISNVFSGMGGACEYSDDGDPIVLFDEDASRWLVSQFAIGWNWPDGPFYQCIAISDSSDPTGGWYTYQFSFDKLNDYPHFGVWPDPVNNAYFMSINQFDPANDFAWGGQGLVAFDRASMLVGDPAGMFYFDAGAMCEDYGPTDPTCFLGGMLPSDLDGALSGSENPGWFVQVDDDAWSNPDITVPDQLEIWGFYTDFPGDYAEIWYDTAVPVDAFDSNMCNYARSCIGQPGTTQGLDAIGDRIMYRLQFRDFGDYFTLVTNHTVDVGGDHAGIRWYELRSGEGWWLNQQGTYAPDSADRWMGSAALDEYGNMAIGFSVADETTGLYPSIRYVGRLFTDPLNTLPRTERTMRSGGGSQTGTASRWGDYSMLDVTYYADGSYSGGQCEFWYTNEYLRGTTPVEWYTYIANFSFDACYWGDNISPVTTIDTYPPDPSHVRDATFTFSATDDWVGVDFSECALDGAPMAECESPISYTGLSTASHTFCARSTDYVGNVESPLACYTWDVDRLTATFVSVASQDGWVLENTETSETGGSTSNTDAYLRAGDSTSDRQYKSILSFNTATLPDTAVVLSATVSMKYKGIYGDSPFMTMAPLQLDITMPFFGGSAGLANGDFQSPAGFTNAGSYLLTGGWYNFTLFGGAYPFVNELGTTQFRLYFLIGDNDDLNEDYLKLYSGNAAPGDRPVLTIEYYVP
jgi:hypothetical protein